MPRDSLFHDPGELFPYRFPEPPPEPEAPEPEPEPEDLGPLYAEAPHPGTLRVAAFGTALTLVAFTAPLGLLASIVPILDVGTSGRTWILSSMSVGLAGGLLVAGALADDLGRKRTFLAGLAVFAVGSFVAAAAGSATTLSLGRAIQGLGGAALLSSSLALIAFDHPPGPGRVRATGFWGAMLGLGIALGPIAAAVLDELGGWHTPYWLLTAVTLVAIRPAAKALRESTAPRPRQPDLLGALLLFLGLASLTAGIVEGNGSGWDAVSPWLFLLVAVVMLWTFANVELRTRDPLFDIRLLGHGPFVAALAGSFALGFTAISFMSYVMTFLRLTLDAGPVAATFWGVPWAAVSFLVALRARAIGRFLAPHLQVGIGLALVGAGLLTMLWLDGASRPSDLVPGLVVMGLGTGMLNAALAQQAVSVVPPHRSGMGAGANNTARYLGAALGVALVVGLLHAGTEQRATEILRGVVDPPIARELAKVIADGGPLDVSASFDADDAAVINRVVRSSSTYAMNRVIFVSAVLAFFSAFVCTTLMRPGSWRPRRE